MKYSTLIIYHTIIAITTSIALAGAYVSESFFDAHPCTLCIYQRYAYAVMMVISSSYIIYIYYCHNVKLDANNFSHKAWLLLSIVSIFIGNALSIFHSGIERHWWSYESSCTGFNGKILSMQDMIHSIEHAPIVACDALGPQLLGLTMANYSVIMLTLLSLGSIGIYHSPLKPLVR